MRPQNEINYIMTVKDLSDYLRCDASTVYRLAKNGTLPSFKVGSDWRFEKARIDEWMRRAG